MKNTVERIIEWVRARDQQLCVSLCIPLKRTMPDKAHNQAVVKRAVHDACHRLKKIGGSEADMLCARLEALYEQFDFVTIASDGVAILCDSGRSETIWLHNHKLFQLDRALVEVGYYFALHSVLRYMQIPAWYWLLVLSNEYAQLFKGEYAHLEELVTPEKDSAGESQQGFPLDPIGPSDHAKQAFAVGDKGDHYLIRLRETFMRLVDGELGRVLHEHELLPVVIAAAPELITQFKQITHHKQHIIATLPHDYIDATRAHDLRALGSMAWDALMVVDAERSAALMQACDEAVGQKRFVVGVQLVWEMIADGRVHVLLLSAQQTARGGIDAHNPRRIYVDAHLDSLADICIAHAFKKGATVRIMPDGMLPAGADGFAALLRY